MLISITDIIIIVVFVVAVIWGYRKGIIRQAGSISGVILGLVACWIFGADAAAFAAKCLPSAGSYVATFIGYLALFLLVWFCAWSISLMVRKIVHTLCLGPVDGLAGSIFMVFKWALVASLLLNAYAFCQPQSPLFVSSRLFNGELLKSIVAFAPWLWGLVVPTI